MNHLQILQMKNNRKPILTGLKTVESYLGQDYPLVIGGERITTEDKIVSYNPANKEEVDWPCFKSEPRTC